MQNQWEIPETKQQQNTKVTKFKICRWFQPYQIVSNEGPIFRNTFFSLSCFVEFLSLTMVVKCSVLQYFFRELDEKQKTKKLIPCTTTICCVTVNILRVDFFFFPLIEPWISGNSRALQSIRSSYSVVLKVFFVLFFAHYMLLRFYWLDAVLKSPHTNQKSFREMRKLQNHAANDWNKMKTKLAKKTVLNAFVGGFHASCEMNVKLTYRKENDSFGVFLWEVIFKEFLYHFSAFHFRAIRFSWIIIVLSYFDWNYDLDALAFLFVQIGLLFFFYFITKLNFQDFARSWPFACRQNGKKKKNY